MTPRVLTLLVALAPLTAACGDAPADRYAEALAAAEREELEVYSLYFTQRSADVVRASQEVRAREGRDFAYFDDVYELLPRGQVLDSHVEGEVARVRVQGQRKEVTVQMRQERGLWVVDGFALPGFWAPLKEPVE